MRFKQVVVALLFLAVTVQPVVAQQAGSASPTPWRRYAFALAGAAVLGGLAAVSSDFEDSSSEQAVSSSTSCATANCLVPIGVVLGGGLGFILGYEMDQKALKQYGEGPSLQPALNSVAIRSNPISIVATSAGVVALTGEGVDLVDPSFNVRRISTGMTGRAATLVPSKSIVVVATNTALNAVPLAGGAEVLLAESGAAALASLGEGAVAVAELGRIRRVSVEGVAGGYSLLEDATSATRGLAAALILGEGGEALWAVVDSMLVSRNPRTLSEVGHLNLPGKGRSVTVQGRTGMVAMGPDGAVVVNLSDASSPTVTSRLTGMTYAYGAAAFNGRGYVASGPQGVFVFDLSSPSNPVSLGVIREFGFAADVLVYNGRLHILDREGERLYRLAGGS